MHLFKKRRLKGGAVILAIVALCIEGCASRVVYLGSSSTKMVQLRQTVKGVKVWVKDATGTPQPAVADLLEGGYYRNDLELEQLHEGDEQARARLTQLRQ